VKATLVKSGTEAPATVAAVDATADAEANQKPHKNRRRQ